jgi:hypothetical protein
MLLLHPALSAFCLTCSRNKHMHEGSIRVKRYLAYWKLTPEEQGMERLTKKELRALLEFIKKCYPICELETFAQRVVSINLFRN